jgi:L-fuculose-phosphate aldolase
MMPTTLELPKEQLVSTAHERMKLAIPDLEWNTRERLALACRILFDNGHDAGLAGQITARSESGESFYTQRFGLGFDEISASNLVHVDQDLNVIGDNTINTGMANPANRFHTWIYRCRPDVNCIIHTHPLHIAALSMLEVPLAISHMDTCPLYDDCAFLKDWPGIPVGNQEGEIIAAALGQKRTILLSHHGQLVTGRTVEEACLLALLIERAARMQLLAMAAGDIKPIPEVLGKEAHGWISTPKRHQASFAYYARRALRSHPDCLA